jgi:hypothetical protein
MCYPFMLNVITGGVSLIPVLSNSTIWFGQSSSVVATQKLPCHKPSTWFLLVVLHLYVLLRFLISHHLLYLEVWWLNWGSIWKSITNFSLFGIPSILGGKKRSVKVNTDYPSTNNQYLSGSENLGANHVCVSQCAPFANFSVPLSIGYTCWLLYAEA